MGVDRTGRIIDKEKRKYVEYVRFGNTGMMVSRLCLGTMTVELK